MSRNERKSDQRKQSLYFPDEMIREMGAESTRQDRSLSWLMQTAWRIARGEILKMPAAPGATMEPRG